MTEPAFRVDIDIHEPGDNAQAKYLVHGYDDVLWTDDPGEALEYVSGELRRNRPLNMDDASKVKKVGEMSVAPTAFPVPGENFIDRAGAIRGVTEVTLADDGTIHVDYIEGEPEDYPHSRRIWPDGSGGWIVDTHTAETLLMQYSEWLDVEGVQFNAGPDEDLVREFIAQRNPQARPKVVTS